MSAEAVLSVVAVVEFLFIVGLMRSHANCADDLQNVRIDLVESRMKVKECCADRDRAQTKAEHLGEQLSDALEALRQS